MAPPDDIVSGPVIGAPEVVTGPVIGPGAPGEGPAAPVPDPVPPAPPRARLRIMYNFLHYRQAAVASSEATGFAARNLYDGSRHSFWRGSGLGVQTHTFDAGLGRTESPTALALTRADLLVAVGAWVSLQWSDDGATAWTDAIPPLEPIQLSHLSAPTFTDYYTEWPLLAKRAWRLRIAGSMSAAPQLAGFFLGTALEVEKNPLYGATFGRTRAHQGSDVAWTFRRLTEAGMDDLLAALTDVSPHHPAEQPYETAAGALYGGRPHFLYDPLGESMRLGLAGRPGLLNVILMNPGELTPTLDWLRLWSLGPARWRTLT